jgi:hypothetical protein
MQYPTTIELGSISWTSTDLGTVKSLQLGSIPDGVGDLIWNCRKLQLDIKVQYDTSATSPPTLLELLELVDNLKMQVAGENVLNNVSVRDIVEILAEGHCRHGEDPDLPSAPTADASDEVRHIQIPVEFSRDDLFKPDDFACPAQLLNGKYLYARANEFSGVDNSVDAVVISLSAEIELIDHPRLVALPIYEAQTKQTHESLPPGLYSELFIRKPSGGFSAGDLDTVQLTANGIDIYDHVDCEHIYMRYKFARSIQNGSIDGLYGGGAVESWDEDEANAIFLPLIFPWSNDNKNRLSHLLDTFGALLHYQIKGNLTEFTFVSRRYIYLDEALAKRQAVDMGITDVEALQGHRGTANSRDIVDSGEIKKKAGMRQLPVTITGVASAREALPSRISRAAASTVRKLRARRVQQATEEQANRAASRLFSRV